VPLNPELFAVLGLAAIVGLLAAVAGFVVLRFTAAGRHARRSLRRGDADTLLVSAALEEAVRRLKAQERATAARAEASERLNGQIIASLTAGLLVVGIEGQVRILNPAARRMLRIPDTAALDDYRRLLGHPALTAVLDECLATQAAIVRRTVRLPGPNAGVTHLGVTVSPLFGDGRTLHGAICLFTDLTMVKQLEERLRLKESLAAVGELTAGIAHEFRNGLATIHGYSKLFDLAALPPAHRTYVEGIRAEAESLGQVVTNFLQFARPAELTLSRVDLRAVCERVAEEVRGEAQRLGGVVTVAGDFPTLDGDDVLLRQAFSNLARNAMEACSGTGAAPQILFRGEIDPLQGTARVTVEDNGPGIEPAAREQIFRPFFTSKRNGTGLGLALVQKIVVFHNGRISAAVSPLGGASLEITLPLAT
jgi:signal transduction histidine kinase